MKLESERVRIKAIMDKIYIGISIIYKENKYETEKTGIVTEIKKCNYQSSHAHYCNVCVGYIGIDDCYPSCMLATNSKTGKCNCKIIEVIAEDFIKKEEFMI